MDFMLKELKSKSSSVQPRMTPSTCMPETVEELETGLLHLQEYLEEKGIR